MKLIQLDVYEDYENISASIDYLIINEFSLWDHSYDKIIGLNSLFNICESYEKIIKEYEKGLI